MEVTYLRSGRKLQQALAGEYQVEVFVVQVRDRCAAVITIRI